MGAAGCSDDSETPEDGGGGSGGEPSVGGAGGNGAAGGGGSADGGGGSGGGGGENGWATGGTGSMTGEYDDPFPNGPGKECSLICSTTMGPCYAMTVDRKDISEGYPGLPVRLALLVVDDACEPVANATVDIWHTSNRGLYSGSDAIDFCTTGDEDARTHRFMRGVQTTDADGRVDFDTCFPGWYPGRAIHIHFTIKVGDAEYVTSQLFFPESINQEIFAVHPEYEEFGAPDTPNGEDGIYAAANEVLVSKLPDNAMMAKKVIVIRSNLADPLCAT